MHLPAGVPTKMGLFGNKELQFGTKGYNKPVMEPSEQKTGMLFFGEEGGSWEELFECKSTGKA